DHGRLPAAGRPHAQGDQGAGEARGAAGMSAVPRASTTRARTPHRQFNRAARPALHLGDFGSLDALAAELQRRVREMLYARGAGTLVACDLDGGVYLLMELEMRTERFYAEHFEWVVGVYASAPAN